MSAIKLRVRSRCNSDRGPRHALELRLRFITPAAGVSSIPALFPRAARALGLRALGYYGPDMGVRVVGVGGSSTRRETGKSAD